MSSAPYIDNCRLVRLPECRNESHRTHLCRSFKRCTGVTVHTYRQFLRLRSGLVRLEQTDTSLADLALDLGFSHQSHFTEAFRKVFGAPPGKVRKVLRRLRSIEGAG